VTHNCKVVGKNEGMLVEQDSGTNWRYVINGFITVFFSYQQHSACQ